ncbi:MAG: hypothetical protein ACT4N2_00225 [Hyphomicrobium sp.]
MKSIANKVGKAVLSGALATSLIVATAAPSHAKGHRTAVLVGTILLGTAVIVAASKRRR